MDNKDRSAQKPVSILQGDGFYFDRFLSRDQTSVGYSSRVYYRSAEGVPFKWEMQPGTPKNPPEDEVIPPVTLPPAVQSLGLPRPCLDQPKPSTWSSFWFWKKIKKSQQSKELQKKSESNNGTSAISSDNERFEFGDSDKEFIASQLHNSSSSSFSSSSSSNGPPLPPSRIQRDLLDGPLCCSPSNITAIMNEGSTNIYYCNAQNGFLFYRSPSRESSVSSSSSRIYYRSAEGIPFKWEMQPGTSKNPPEEEVIPPPSPPPAVQSLGLLPSRPNCVDRSPRGSNPSKAWFWKKDKKYEHSRKIEELSSDEFENLDQFCHSDSEIAPSLRQSSCSSSSSGDHSLPSSGISLDKPFWCSAWNLTAILVCVPRRV